MGWLSSKVISNKPVLSPAKMKLLERYAQGSSMEACTPIRKRPAAEPILLSRFQEEIWQDSQDGKRVPSFYNESTTIHRYGELNRKAMELAFTEILRRHEAWRTVFDTLNRHPIQVIRPIPSSFSIPFVDLRKVSANSRWQEAMRLASEDARRPFDLTKGPLVRAFLTTLDEHRHSLFVTMHQSITDGLSVYQILPFELSALYSKYSGGDSCKLPDLPMQYADLAYWDRARNQEVTFEEDLAFWRKELAGEIPKLIWPSETTPSSGATRRGAIQAFALPTQLCRSLTEASKREGVTLFMMLLAGFALLLHYYTESEDIVTGTVAPTGRKTAEAGKLLGYFLNPVALRVDVSGDPTVRDVLRECRRVTSEALSHDSIPFGIVREHLKPQTPTQLWPFNTAITLAPPLPTLGDEWSQTSMDCDCEWAKWDLYLEFAQRPNEVLGRAQYQTDAFSSVIILRLIEDLEKVLDGMAGNSDQRISQLRRVYENRQ
ncbi:MAG: hypothetical protein JO340_08330 [Acidobacteriaceae bacterium]|nr:hypothetical protein [Acidobacteriaceae bacterium]